MEIKSYKVAAVYGNMHNGSTRRYSELFLKKLEEKLDGKLMVTEICLPRDLPHFCAGCFSCFNNGEQSCPHHEQTTPIAQALDEADLILLASPSYGCDVSGQMKAFIDHFCYMWLPHRPRKSMFCKVGVVVSTTAGAGVKHTAKTMKTNLKYWGVPRIYSLKKAVAASSWAEVSEKNKEKLTQSASKTAARAAGALQKASEGRLKPSLFIRMLFTLMRKMQKGNDWNKTDRDYWEQMGWLGEAKPF